MVSDEQKPILDNEKQVSYSSVAQDVDNDYIEKNHDYSYFKVVTNGRVSSSKLVINMLIKYIID